MNSEKQIRLSMTDKIEFSLDGQTFTTPLLTRLWSGAPTVDAMDVMNMLIVATQALQTERNTIKSLAVAVANAALVMEGANVEVFEREVEEIKDDA